MLQKIKDITTGLAALALLVAIVEIYAYVAAWIGSTILNFIIGLFLKDTNEDS